MPRLRIPDLGSVGMISDIIPSLAPPAAWTNLINCSTNDNSIGSMRGERRLFDLQIKPTYHSTYQSPDGRWFVIVSDGVSVHAVDLITKTAKNITPPGDAWASGFTSFANLNGVLVVNNAMEGMFFWDTGATLPADQILKPCPGWDAGWRCEMVCAYRYYLVALNMTEADVNYKHKVRWSNSAQEGDLPTEWVASTANDAGDDLLGETGGAIVGGALVRDSLYIVKEDAIYAMSWIGGEYVMRVDRLKSEVGTRIKRGFFPAMGGIIVFTSSDCIYFDGQNATSIVDMRIRRTIYATLSEELWELSQVYVAPTTSQIYIAGARAGAINLSDAFVFNYEEKTWGHRRLVNSYGFDTIFVTDAVGTLTWDELGGKTWDEQNDGTWNKGVYQPSVPDTIVYESNDTDTAWWVSVISFELGNSDGTPKYCMAERVGLPIGRADQMMMITEVWPEAVGEAVIQISVGAQIAEGGEIIWDGPHNFEVGKQASIKPRVTGRFVGIRVESHTLKSWQLGALTYDFEPAGER